MRQYTTAEQVLSPKIAVAASQTNKVVSKVFSVSMEGSRHMRVKVTTSATTVAAAINFKLQQATGEADTFITTTKSTSITGNGDFYLTLNAEVSGDQAELPLMPIARIVVTTGAGDAVTIDNVKIMQGG